MLIPELLTGNEGSSAGCSGFSGSDTPLVRQVGPSSSTEYISPPDARHGRECGHYPEPQSQPHPDSPNRSPQEGSPPGLHRAGGGALPTVALRAEPQAWLGLPPGTALPATQDPGLGQARTATHRTPSLRPKSSWSGSPLRWKTAMTPLWMLRGGEGRGALGPEPPSLSPHPRAPHPPATQSPPNLLQEQ